MNTETPITGSPYSSPVQHEAIEVESQCTAPLWSSALKTAPVRYYAQFPTSQEADIPDSDAVEGFSQEETDQTKYLPSILDKVKGVLHLSRRS